MKKTKSHNINTIEHDIMRTIIKSIIQYYNIYNTNYCLQKKWVLSWFLNAATDGASLIDEGNSFHTFGA